MRWHRSTGLLALVALLSLGGVTYAQPQPYVRQGTNPYYTPPLSPWLNMLRGGNPAVNYYLGVLPEFQQRTLNAQYGAQLQMMNQRLGAEGAEAPEMNELLPTLSGTGHGTQFMNASPYFALNPYLGQTAGLPRRPQGRTTRPGGR